MAVDPAILTLFDLRYWPNVYWYIIDCVDLFWHLPSADGVKPEMS